MYAIPEVITLAEQIQDKLAQYMAITGANGTKEYDVYYSDALMVFSLKRALEFENTYPDSLEFDEVQNCIDKILEYYYAIELDDPTFVGSNYSEQEEEVVVVTDRSTYTLTITSNGQTVITDIPFNVENIDIDTLDLYINGDHIAYSTNPANEAYHMVTNILYWHGAYELKIGDIGILKWG